MIRENQRELISNQVVDPQAAALYALVASRLAPERGPYLLRRTDLATGTVRTGPEFAGQHRSRSGLSVDLHRAGPARKQVSTACHPRVSPKTLIVVRSVSFPPPGLFPDVSVAAGPGVSVWIGDGGDAWLISAVTGMVVNKVTVPAGFSGSWTSPSTRPACICMSPCAAPARRAARMPSSSTTPLPGACSPARSTARLPSGWPAAELTATPPGVWASYRTGMLGATILLRQRGLVTVQPPDGGGPGPGSVYVWGMGATTVYGGGTLWLANEGGVLACSSPQSGAVRAKTRTRPGLLVSSELLAVNPAAHLVYGRGSGRLIAISPPARCWR